MIGPEIMTFLLPLTLVRRLRPSLVELPMMNVEFLEVDTIRQLFGSVCVRNFRDCAKINKSKGDQKTEQSAKVHLNASTKDFQYFSKVKRIFWLSFDSFFFIFVSSLSS